MAGFIESAKRRGRDAGNLHHGAPKRSVVRMPVRTKTHGANVTSRKLSRIKIFVVPRPGNIRKCATKFSAAGSVGVSGCVISGFVYFRHMDGGGFVRSKYISTCT